MHPQLDQDIQREKNRLLDAVARTPVPGRTLKVIDGTGGKVDIADLIAYQIGWAKCLLRWYECGKRGEMPEMPGDGFLNWDYVAIAKHFYQKYRYDASHEQMEVFDQVVSQLIDIVKTEQEANRLDQIGIWAWCTLASGKPWPLSKWIRVNTASPYKRAVQLIKKAARAP